MLLAAQRHGHRLGRLLSHDDDEQVLLRLVGLTLLVAGLPQAVAFGLATDLGAILPALPAAVALAVVTAGTTIGTGWFAARRDGVAVPGRLRAGTALVARGEFSIVIAGLAVAAGIPEVGPVATGYVLLLAVTGPVLTRVVEPLSARWRPAVAAG